MDRRVESPKSFWATLAKLRSNLPALLVESLLITFGVLLAFAIDSWKAQKKLEQDTGIVLENLKNEILSNRTIVLEWLSYHDSLTTKLNTIMDSPASELTNDHIDKSFLESIAPEPSISYLLQSTAWQTAHSTQVVKQFKYLTIHNLTHGYESQEGISELRKLIFEKLHDYRNESSSRGRTLAVLASIYQEISDKEKYLLNVYRDALIEVDRELTTRNL